MSRDGASGDGATVALKGFVSAGIVQRVHLQRTRAWGLVGDAAAGIPVGRNESRRHPGGLHDRGHCALDLGVPFNCPNAPVPPAWEEGGVGTDAAARPARACYRRRRSEGKRDRTFSEL